MSFCGKPVDVVVSKGWGHKVIQLPCGSTSEYGYPNMCEECAKINEGRNWRREAEEAGERWDEEDY